MYGCGLCWRGFDIELSCLTVFPRTEDACAFCCSQMGGFRSLNPPPDWTKCSQQRRTASVIFWLWADGKPELNDCLSGVWGEVLQLFSCTSEPARWLPLSRKVLREKTGVLPQHLCGTSVVQGVNCVFYRTLWGGPIKASHPPNMSAHITTPCDCSIWELGCVFLLCSCCVLLRWALRWPVMGAEPWGSLCHISAPVRGSLLAGWSSHGEYVAFTVNHNADSLLPDCIGGSRDLP